MSIRFAPSPTGTFHVGNLRTAWISHQWALKLKMPWVVRFEDIDRPRVMYAAKESQLADMRTLGLVPDQMMDQSDRWERHVQVFEAFRKEGFVYPCFCSRQMVREALEGLASAPHASVPHYNGHCRHLKKFPVTNLPTLAWRLKMPDESGRDDFIVARTSTHLDSKGIPKKDSFVPAYHWACAIDDVDGNYQLLVRAWDLENVTDLQRAIQKNLCRLEGKKIQPAAIFHCALIVQNDGHRLEKRTQGVTLEELLKSGHTPESLIQKFSTSFSKPTAHFTLDQVFGESKKQMTLDELGI